MTIIHTFFHMVEKTHEKFDKAKIIIKARWKDLIITVAAWTGGIYEKGGAEFKEFRSRDRQEQSDAWSAKNKRHYEDQGRCANRSTRCGSEDGDGRIISVSGERFRCASSS